MTNILLPSGPNLSFVDLDNWSYGREVLRFISSSPQQLQKYGFDHVYPSVDSIASTGSHVLGKRGAQEAWNYMNWSLAVAALLNWQWSQTEGPRTALEKVMFWTLLVGGAASGFRFVQVRSYKPLFCLWVAPVFALAGLAMS